jgi:hypothetical protein
MAPCWPLADPCLALVSASAVELHAQLVPHQEGRLERVRPWILWATLFCRFSQRLQLQGTPQRKCKLDPPYL